MTKDKNKVFNTTALNLCFFLKLEKQQLLLHTYTGTSAHKNCLDPHMDVQPALDTVANLASLSEQMQQQSQRLVQQLNDVTSKINEAEAESMERIREAQQKLEEDLARFHKLTQEVDKRARAAQHKIRLNIGGQLFGVAKETLLVPDTFFHAMLGSDRWKPDDDGEYFVDRDPLLFPIILTFLRTSVWKIDNLSQQDRESLQEEIDFYQLMPVKKTIIPSFDPKKCGLDVVLSNNFTTCTGSSNTVLAKQPLLWL